MSAPGSRGSGCFLLGFDFFWLRTESRIPAAEQQFPQAPPRFVVIGLHEPEALIRWDLPFLGAPKGNYSFARDHFEPSLFVRGPHITAIQAHRDRSIRQRLLFPLLFRSFEQVACRSLPSSFSMRSATACR